MSGPPCGVFAGRSPGTGLSWNCTVRTDVPGALLQRELHRVLRGLRRGAELAVGAAGHARVLAHLHLVDVVEGEDRLDALEGPRLGGLGRDQPHALAHALGRALQVGFVDRVARTGPADPCPASSPSSRSCCTSMRLFDRAAAIGLDLDERGAVDAADEGRRRGDEQQGTKSAHGSSSQGARRFHHTYTGADDEGGSGTHGARDGRSAGIGRGVRPGARRAGLRADSHRAPARTGSRRWPASSASGTACRSHCIAADLAEPAAPAGGWSPNSSARGLHVDVLVNNAGYGVPGRFERPAWAEHEAFLRVMVDGRVRADLPAAARDGRAPVGPHHQRRVAGRAPARRRPATRCTRPARRF